MSINRVIVIGGGPAGMMAAAAAGSRGHQVTCWRKMRNWENLFNRKGRCNITNNADIEEFIQKRSNKPQVLYTALYLHQPGSAAAS